MATAVRSAVNKLRHDNHTPTGSLVERTPSELFNVLTIFNEGPDQGEVSFDGVNSFPIKSLSSFSMEADQQKSYWTSSAGTAVLKVLLGSEE